MRRHGPCLSALALAAALLGAAAAPVPADVLVRFAVPGAGCLDAASENHRLSGALGQSAVGRSASESYRLTAGFWSVPGASGPTAVEPPSASPFRRPEVHPNPAVAEAAVVFDLPRAGVVRVRVLDVGGRVVRTLARGWRERGRQTVRWDGRDEAGARAPAGLYWAEVGAGADRALTKFIRLR